MPHTKIEKHKCSDQIYSNSMNLIIYKQIQLKSIKNHIKLHKLCKQMPKKKENNPHLSWILHNHTKRYAMI